MARESGLQKILEINETGIASIYVSEDLSESLELEV